tara:strand:+ start:439 stop:726 length:288 start_codon:yes stop_codon:yes gene_type:complete
VSGQRLKLQIGDYVRWETGVTMFSASAAGTVSPIEFRYSYGIVVDLAHGVPENDTSDVVIVYNFDNGDWVVAPVDDDKYKFELISSVMTVKGSVI